MVCPIPQGDHNKLLASKTSDLVDRHFIIRSLYKTYTDTILYTKLIC